MKKNSFCFAAPFVVPFVLLAASPARATPNFPPAIQQHLGLAAPPPCRTCHVTGEQGGKGTVNTLFGAKMRSRGLVEFDEASLRTALDALRAEGSDVDQDGVSDIQELIAGTDPNNPPGGDSETPSYGCGARVSATRTLPDAPVLWATSVLAIAAIWIRRRGRAAAEAVPLPRTERS